MSYALDQGDVDELDSIYFQLANCANELEQATGLADADDLSLGYEAFVGLVACHFAVIVLIGPLLHCWDRETGRYMTTKQRVVKLIEAKQEVRVAARMEAKPKKPGKKYESADGDPSGDGEEDG